MNKKRQRVKYLVSDFLTATFVWMLLNGLRYVEIAQYDEGFSSMTAFFSSDQVIEGQVLIPFFWLTLYYFSGYYNEPFGKSRIGEWFTTFVTVSIGTVFIFFSVILNDLPSSFTVYYLIFFTYYFLQFIFTYFCRLCITNHAIRKVKRREWMRNVLIIGVGNQALKTREELRKSGYRVLGFVRENDRSPLQIDSAEWLGTMDELPQLMNTHSVDELILALEPDNDAETIRILYSLYHYNRPIKIRMEKNHPLLRAEVRSIHGMPLIEVTANHFSAAGKNIKYAMDKIIAVLVLTLLSPLYVYIAVGVKRSSRGPALFKQERIGYRGRPFTIYKFRTMYVDPQPQEPLLTEKDDPRVTPFGRFLRKYRMDELPQFWNILRGDMSLVGPRPEQRYYIDRIVREAPYYYLLHNVRPGITSWGMVKYGYADTVDKMIERLNYDIMYYKNMSLTLDLTILIYTVKIVFTGKGV